VLTLRCQYKIWCFTVSSDRGCIANILACSWYPCRRKPVIVACQLLIQAPLLESQQLRWSGLGDIKGSSAWAVIGVWLIQMYSSQLRLQAHSHRIQLRAGVCQLLPTRYCEGSAVAHAGWQYL
jgi:hypothetical protein